MIRAVIVAWLAICLPVAAQWPSWSRPMEKSFDRGNQALSSAVERLNVSVGPQAWTNYITTNIWASYFSQGAKLKASKNMMKAAIDGAAWVKQSATWTPETSEGVTASNVLAWSGAPAGYWTNHPYVNLAAVSNGWMFWPAIASNVAWISTAFSPGQSNGTEVLWTGTGATFAAAAASAVAESQFAASTNAMVGEYVAIFNLDGYDGYYGVWVVRCVADMYYTIGGYLAQDAAALEVWSKLNAQDQVDSMIIFDPQGCPVSTSLYVQVHTETLASGAWSSAYFSQIPNGYTYPTNTSPEPSKGWSLGWYADDLADWKALHKFNATTNGFQWFR